MANDRDTAIIIGQQGRQVVFEDPMLLQHGQFL